MPKLGILVVGQSPRPEVEKEFTRLIEGINLDLRGCLDGLTRSEISALEPAPEETSLFTRLPSGDGVTLSKAKVIEHGTKQLDSLENSGAQAVVVLCTGEFPMWADRNVLIPSEVMKNFVLAVQPTGHIAVLSPLETQLTNTKKRWGSYGYKVTALALSPNATTVEAEIAGKAFADANPDLLLLDCVSYTAEIKRIVCAAANCPGVLAITAIARVAAEILEGS